jgi:hypothetical protein
MISATGIACEEALVIFPIMFVSDAIADLKERGEQGRIIVGWCFVEANPGNGRAQD